MKIQYYPIDLAHALGMEEITTMYIEHVKGVPVLYLECSRKPGGKPRTTQAQEKEVPQEDPEPQKKESFLKKLFKPQKVQIEVVQGKARKKPGKKPARRAQNTREPAPKHLDFSDMEDRFTPPF